MKKIFVVLTKSLLFVILSLAHNVTIAQGVKSCAFSPDGKIIVFGKDQGIVQVFNDKGALLKTIEIKEINTGGLWIDRVKTAAFSPDGKSFAVLAFNNVYLYSIDGTFIFKNPVEGTDYGFLSFSKKGDTLMFFNDKFIRFLFDCKGNLIDRFDINPYKDIPEEKKFGCNLQGAAMVNNGNLIVDYCIKMSKRKLLWDHYIDEYSTDHKLVHKTKLALNPESYYGIDFSYNRKKNIAFIYSTGTMNSHVSFTDGFTYDPSNGEVKRIFGLESLSKMDFLPSGDSLIGIDNLFKKIYYYDLVSGQHSNFNVTIELYGAFYSPDYKKVLESSYSGVTMYSMKSEKLCVFETPKVETPKTETLKTEVKQQQNGVVTSAILTPPPPKIDASGFAMFAKITYPKTLETKMTGCVAGDCFDGFGYYIANETEEFCGYFVNGVKESIGQLHRPNEYVIYNGFFEAEKPNGYANITYYDRNLTELGTFKNLMPDGEMTIYQNGIVKQALYKGDQITATVRRTGCLSGDCSGGNGVFQKEDGTQFVGDFVNNRLVKGVMFDGKNRIVKFSDFSQTGNYNGITDIFKPNGEVVHGSFVDGVMQGKVFIKSPVNTKTLFVEGDFDKGVGVNISVQFRDGRKWVGKQESATAGWATGVGAMTYPDGTTKTGNFKNGEFIVE